MPFRYNRVNCKTVILGISGRWVERRINADKVRRVMARLIDEQGAPLGPVDRTPRCLLGPGVRSALVAEELAFYQSSR